jgi:hypothetical protein
MQISVVRLAGSPYNFFYKADPSTYSSFLVCCCFKVYTGYLIMKISKLLSKKTQPKRYGHGNEGSYKYRTRRTHAILQG